MLGWVKVIFNQLDAMFGEMRWAGLVWSGEHSELICKAHNKCAKINYVRNSTSRFGACVKYWQQTKPFFGAASNHVVILDLMAPKFALDGSQTEEGTGHKLS